jgi:hypothetical protein
MGNQEIPTLQEGFSIFPGWLEEERFQGQSDLISPGSLQGC